MSIKIMSQIWDQSEQKGAKLLLMLALADYADDSGFCWPSEGTLAKKTRMSDRHVRRMANELQAAGELYIKSGLSKGQSNRYVIMIGLPQETFEHVLRVKLKTPKDEIKQLVIRYYGDDDSSPPPDESPPDAPEGGRTSCPTPEAGGSDNLSDRVGLMSPTGRTHESDDPSLTVSEPPSPPPAPATDLPPPEAQQTTGGDRSPPGGDGEKIKKNDLKQVKEVFSDLTGISPGKRDHKRWSKDAKDLLLEFGSETLPLMKKAWQQLAGPKVEKNQIVITAPGSLRSFMQQVKARPAGGRAAIDPATRAAVAAKEAEYARQQEKWADEEPLVGDAAIEKIRQLKQGKQQFIDKTGKASNQ